MVLTSEEINIIVYKYLQESGFRHTSFAFQYESQVEKSTYRDAQIQPGALINIIHKGLQFMEIEAHMNEEGELVECNVPFSLLEPHTCHANPDDVENESLLPSSSKTQSLNNIAAVSVATSSSTAAASPSTTTTTSTKRKSKEEKRQQKDREKRAKKETITEDEEMPTSNRVKEEIKNDNSFAEKKTNGSSSNTTASLAAASVAISKDMDEEMGDVQSNNTEIKPEDVVILQGHQSEVFSCAWNPVISSLLASGSGDATARLWEVPEGRDKTTAEPIVLNHLPNMNDNKDVTTLDWNPSGSLLVTGSYDGQARIWTQKGQLRFVMSHHRGPIFSLKWNMKGDLVLSGSADTTTIIWDPETGEMRQQFELHSLAILDVDWMDNTTFASCSSDKTIYVCRVGSAKPLKKWVGHEDEVNAVRWDPTGQYLASCSDDMTTKIWSMASDEPIQEIKGHNLQIYTLQWAPYTQKDTSNSSPRILATASFDATVRIWDALKGTCLHVLKNHSEAVYSISFSPDARLLASGSFDEVLNVWDAKDGSLKKTFKADGGIFEVHFNKTGDKLAACTSNKQVVILNHMKN